MRQMLAVPDLKRLLIAEIDRHLGDHGIVLDVSIEPLPEPGDGANFRLTLPVTLHGHLTSSPMPLEPADAGARVQASLATPYRDPRRSTAPAGDAREPRPGQEVSP